LAAEDESRPALNQSVERAAKLLSLFTAAEPALTLRQIEERAGLTRATAHRYATALRRGGLLRFSDGVYTLGPRIVELASVALAGLGVVKLAGPYLDRLAETTNETAVLSVWDGEAPVVVRSTDSPNRLVRIVIVPGSRLRVDSAQGTVFRAFIERPPGPPFSRIREERVMYAETVDGIAAIAAPVFQGQEIVATMAVVGTRVSIQRDEHEITRTLTTSAQELSEQLGYVEPEDELQSA
jgi:DNA-binding IclR family transcriptional regulator